MQTRPISSVRTSRLRNVAQHEAAHAVVALTVGDHVTEIAINEKSKGGVAGYCRERSDLRRHGPLDVQTETQIFRDLCSGIRSRGSTPPWVFDHLVKTLAGFAFELGEHNPDAWVHAATNRDRAMSLAKAVMPNSDAATRLVEYALLRAASIVDRERGPIVLLGDLLLARLILSGSEVKRALREFGFPTPVGYGTNDVDAWPATVAVVPICRSVIL